MTAIEWKALHADCRTVINGVRYGLKLDCCTGATVLEPVDDDITMGRHRRRAGLGNTHAHGQAKTVPTWLQTAFSDWITRRLYVDRRGNYRSRVPNRHIVPYNRSLRRLYQRNEEFHRAAHLWLALWEAVPIARLVRTDRVDTTPGRRS